MSSEKINPTVYSPYNFFSAQQWEKFRGDLPLNLTIDEIEGLRSLGDFLDLEEVRRIYLPIARLLGVYYEANQLLFLSRQKFLSLSKEKKGPFILGIAGSVAVGKSTTARLLKLLLAKEYKSLNVELITSDGFLYPNARLEALGLMEKKGFPESYDMGSLLRFLSSIKAGRRHIKVPRYSHLEYDVLPYDYDVIDCPDILIFEGINVLQVRELPKDGKLIPFISDFFDFSIYIDAEIDLIRSWYIERFMKLRETAFKDPLSFFKSYANWDEEKARNYAKSVWDLVNLRNLKNNILPTRPRANLILSKGQDHRVQSIALRKL